MPGWIVTNKYLSNYKFELIKKSFLKEASELNIQLEYYDNVQAQINLDKKIYPEYVIFFDKDIYLGKRIEMLNIKMFNNINSIEICDDKAKTYLELNKYNIKQPYTIISPFSYNINIANDDKYIKYIEEKFDYPFIIKECFGSFGEQVFLINNINELKNIIDRINGKQFIIQEFIKTSYGKDIRVQVVGGKVSCSIKRINNKNDFRANLTIGSSAEIYDLNNKQKQLALEVCKILNLSFAGVDILFGENDEPILCEVNSNAHIDNISKICSINVAKEILIYIKKVIENEI